MNYKKKHNYGGMTTKCIQPSTNHHQRCDSTIKEGDSSIKNGGLDLISPMDMLI